MIDYRRDLRITRVCGISINHDAAQFAELNVPPQVGLNAIDREIRRAQARLDELRSARTALVTHTIQEMRGEK